MNRGFGMALVAAFIFIASPVVAQDAKQTAIAELVRTLGYGGAIHNFKNFVMRGEQQYGDAAKAQFTKAAQVLSALGEQELSPAEKQAVNALKKMVSQYRGQVDTVKELHTQKKTVEQIDESVAVDDSAAIRALATLRAGRTWSKMQDLDYQIGYGGGIHHFKNYILRADEEYHTGALLGLSKVLLIVSRYGAGRELPKDQLKALDDIEAVVRAYQQALTKAETLIGEGKTAKEIDDVVKIDDSPALKGLATLRKR